MTVDQQTLAPVVGIIMGSDSDWPVMKPADEQLADFGIPHEVKIVSAHRTPDRLVDYCRTAQSRGIKIIIAGAGGAAHLPGMAAAFSHLPVIGVPVQSKALSGQDSLLSIVQMPPGAPVGTMAINGAKNAAIYAAQMLAISDAKLAGAVREFFVKQAAAVPDEPKRA